MGAEGSKPSFSAPDPSNHNRPLTRPEAGRVTGFTCGIPSVLVYSSSETTGRLLIFRKLCKAMKHSKSQENTNGVT